MSVVGIFVLCCTSLQLEPAVCERRACIKYAYYRSMFLRFQGKVKSNYRARSLELSVAQSGGLFQAVGDFSLM